MPALALIDGAEEAPSPADRSAAEEGPGGGLVVMAVGLRILVQSPVEAEVPPLLNDLQARAVRALYRDSATGDPDPGFKGLVQWCVYRGCRTDDVPDPREGALPTSLRQVLIEIARTERELDPYEQG